MDTKSEFTIKQLPESYFAEFKLEQDVPVEFKQEVEKYYNDNNDKVENKTSTPSNISGQAEKIITVIRQTNIEKQLSAYFNNTYITKYVQTHAKLEVDWLDFEEIKFENILPHILQHIEALFTTITLKFDMVIVDDDNDEPDNCLIPLNIRCIDYLTKEQFVQVKKTIDRLIVMNNKLPIVGDCTNKLYGKSRLFINGNTMICSYREWLANIVDMITPIYKDLVSMYS
jgi:hypothetical protein